MGRGRASDTGKNRRSCFCGSSRALCRGLEGNLFPDAPFFAFGRGTTMRFFSGFRASLRDSGQAPAVAVLIIGTVLAIALAISVGGPS
jgi:hypothetical protein